MKTISDQNKSNNGGIYSLKFDEKQPESLFFGSVDEIVFHIDLRTDTKLNPIIKGPLLCPNTLDIYQETVLTGSWGKNHGLFTWDLRKENEILEKMEWPENKNIFSCQFSKHNEILAAGEKSCGVKIFKEKKFYNSDCTEAVFCAKFAKNKDFIICGNDDGQIKISDY